MWIWFGSTFSKGGCGYGLAPPFQKVDLKVDMVWLHLFKRWMWIWFGSTFSKGGCGYGLAPPFLKANVDMVWLHLFKRWMWFGSTFSKGGLKVDLKADKYILI
jgi:hypothetical protein